MRKRALLLAALAFAPAASAHERHDERRPGFVSTVAAVVPNVLGLQATIVDRDRLFVRNFSRSPVVILGESGEPYRRIPAGKSYGWRDPRIRWTEHELPRSVESQPDKVHLIFNWRVPGRTGGRRFAITGFLGYVPPPSAGDEDNDWVVPMAAGVGGAAALAALAVGLWARRARRRAH
jgi:hypothetical protein